MSEKRKDIVLRFGIVYVIICCAFLLVIFKIIKLQTVERERWLALGAQSVKADIVVKANRGNIYACDGQLMASSIPTYYVYMDLRVPALHEKNGKLFKENIDSLAIGLAAYFKDRTVSQYKQSLTQAYNQGKGEYQLFPKRITYSDLKQIKRLPLFRLGKNKSGLITKELLKRVRPFGSLARRTIGDIYADESKGGKNGLELYFNKELLGTPGVSIRHKVANHYMETVQVEPVDGMDVTTTLNVEMQDIAEKALVDSMRSFDAMAGYAILMETKTGEVRAMVNMQQNPDKTFTENRNGAVSDLVEPGSTFKVMSLMAAVDDGKVKITDMIETGAGHFAFGNRVMNDHNAKTGGCGRISLAEAIHISSNIGISRAIVNAYGQNPSAFVDKLYQMKLNEPLDLEIPGTAEPKITHPSDKSKYGWSPTTLPWMSIGYETQIPPIYTLSYYNAIANNGKYIKPIFVKSISRNGQIIKTFETSVINEAICKPSTLKDIKEVLLGVLEGEKGTAKNVRSNFFRIAGKTGTAQISKGKEGYKAGGTSHQVSFCGYFPAEDPQYTMIVVIREPHKGYPSGGKMAGSVFKSIAEAVMGMKSTTHPFSLLNDSTYTEPKEPYFKVGYYKSLSTVMTDLHLPFSTNSTDWVKPTVKDNKVSMEAVRVQGNTIPDVQGMGAKDAVFLAERLGLRVQLFGRGKVISQSLKAGTKAVKGNVFKLTLQ